MIFDLDRFRTLGVGANADVVVWDPTRKISVKTYHQKLDVIEGSGRYVDRPPFPNSYDAVAKMNQAKMPRAVVRSAA